MNFSYFEALAFYLSPSIPLGLGWFELLKSHQANRAAWLPCIVVTTSLIWLFLGIFFPLLMGPYYSGFRYSIIYRNFFLNLAATAVALTFKPKLQIWTTIASMMSACVWLFVEAINSVV